MPMYEYECQSCGQRIEALQRFDDPPLEDCDCGEKGTLKKLISAPAFQFKGSGWYVTDYADKGKKGKDGQEAKSGGGDGSSDGGGESGGSAESAKADGGKKEAKSDSATKSSASKSSDGKAA